MALINCSECGNQVSDKAVACPHCGCPVKLNTISNTSQNDNQVANTSQYTLIQCKSCGNNISNIATNCPHCGCPISKIDETNQITDINVVVENNKDNLIDNEVINDNPQFTDTNDIEKKDKSIYYIIGFISLLILFIVFVLVNTNNGNSTNNNSNDYYPENITLTKNEQKVYDVLVKHILNRAHNPQAVRVVSGNTLFGFKISGTNKVGGTITNCISLMPANYLEEDTCDSTYNDQSQDSEWYIDVYKINQKLEEYWENRGM